MAETRPWYDATDHSWRQWFKDGDTVAVKHVQDLQPLVDVAKRAQNPSVHGKPKAMAGMRHIGWIPNTIIYQALAKYGIEAADWMRWPGTEQSKFYKRILADPEYKYLRSVDKL